MRALLADLVFVGSRWPFLASHASLQERSNNGERDFGGPPDGSSAGHCGWVASKLQRWRSEPGESTGHVWSKGADGRGDPKGKGGELAGQK